MASTNTTTTAFTEALGAIAYTFAEMQPYLPMSLHLILSALFPIYTGAHASLSRPSSAARPPSSRQKRRIKDDGEASSDEESDTEEEQESLSQKMEGLSNSDAILFPLLAGCTLTGLYMLIKYMGPETLNRILNIYFSFMAMFSVGKLVSDGLGVVNTFLWPGWYTDSGVLWKVNQGSKIVVVAGCWERSGTSGLRNRTSPLPGMLGRMNLGPSIESQLWIIRGLLGRKYQIRLQIPHLISIKATLGPRTIVGFVIGVSAIAYANLVSTPWYLTNLQGFAFSYTALQLMSPTSFPTGSLILIALFFYDIYFVFYTPMMVTVAGKLDVPIKLLFPRPPEEGYEDEGRKLAMLGLGDIVLPGIMIGLACRFDLWMDYRRKQTKRNEAHIVKPTKGEQADETTTSDVSVPGENEKNHTHESEMVKQRYIPVTGHWGDRLWTRSWPAKAPLKSTYREKSQVSKKRTPGTTQPITMQSVLPSFSKPYFTASIIGYVLGMIVTLLIMQVFRHAQPALLYLVPGVLGSIWSTALFRGEMKEVWAYSEAFDEEEEEDKEKKQSAKEETEKRDAKAKEAESQGVMSWFKDSFFSTAKAERNAKRLEDSLAKSLQRDDGEGTETVADQSTEATRTAADDNSNSKVEDNPTSGSEDGAKKEKKPEKFHFSIKLLGTSQKNHQQKQAQHHSQTSKDKGSSRPSSSDSASSSTSSAVLISKSELNDSSYGKENMPRWRSSGESIRSAKSGGSSEVDFGDERAGKRVRTG